MRRSRTTTRRPRCRRAHAESSSAQLGANALASLGAELERAVREDRRVEYESGSNRSGRAHCGECELRERCDEGMVEQSARSPRALVVDDDPGSACSPVSGSRASTLRRRAESGSDAIARAQQTLPDLIVLDLVMPQLDGFETCRRLRALPGMQDVPILVTTGLTDTATIDRAYEAGASEFIHKPIDWQLFRHRVRFLMRRTAHSGPEQHAGRPRREPAAPGERAPDRAHRTLRLRFGERRDAVERGAALCCRFRDGEPLGLADFLHAASPGRAGRKEISRPDRAPAGRSNTGSSPAPVTASRVPPDRTEHGAHRHGHIEGTIPDSPSKRRSEIGSLPGLLRPLTGLPNRNYLREQLERVLARHSASVKPSHCVRGSRSLPPHHDPRQTMPTSCCATCAAHARLRARDDLVGRPSEEEASDRRDWSDDSPCAPNVAASRTRGWPRAGCCARSNRRSCCAAAASRWRRASNRALRRSGCDASSCCNGRIPDHTREERRRRAAWCVYETAMKPGPNSDSSSRCAARSADHGEFELAYHPLVGAVDLRSAPSRRCCAGVTGPGKLSPAQFVPSPRSSA